MRAIDVSVYQGNIDWNEVQAPIALIKMSGGDDGLYTDSKASRNYAGAKAAGKAVGMYHFAGGGNAVEEADYFIRCCSPLEKDDVLILDWEVQHADPVGWCKSFIQRVIDTTGVRPLIYMNSYTASSINWQPVVDMNVGLWVAHYGLGVNDNVPVGKFPTYVMHQYTSSGREPGVGGGNANVDVNEWFGTVDQFKKYGWQSNLIQDVTPAPAPSPAPSVPEPAPVQPTPAPTPTPTPPVETSEPVDPTKPVEPEDQSNKITKAIIVRAGWTFLQSFFGVLSAGLVVTTDFNKSTVFALVASAFAAAISAVKNIIKQPTEA